MENKKEYHNVSQPFEMCIENILQFGFITTEVSQKWLYKCTVCLFVFILTTPVAEKDQ